MGVDQETWERNSLVIGECIASNDLQQLLLLLLLLLLLTAACRSGTAEKVAQQGNVAGRNHKQGVFQ